jgi:hypothetical protein
MAPKKKNFDPDTGDQAELDAMRPSKESDEQVQYGPPYGLVNIGRVQANAGQEGAQAVYEQRAHHTGRVRQADDGPDYDPAFQMRRPRVDET